MRQQILINEGWEFRRVGEGQSWAGVALPHSSVEADADGAGHWQGLCEYRRRLKGQEVAQGERQVLWIGGAMHTARVFLDDRQVGCHAGGYLSFEVDLTEGLADGAEHELRLELDNRDNPEVPPGKPFKELDFCWYGGLYRGVELRVYPRLHISDELSAAAVGGGGVFFRTLEAGEDAARCSVRIELVNTGAEERNAFVNTVLLLDGAAVAQTSTLTSVEARGGRIHVEQELCWLTPALWTISAPRLHVLQVTVLSREGAVLDRRTIRVGVRRIAFSRSGGFVLNGRRLRLRGTNRHQEYPTAGYAVGAAADRRDARRIKEAGFDYVRLSHYPQSPAFLDACDELGIVVMNAIPGWQFIGGQAFREACESVAREVVRRDRNHACAVLWELSLNETQMDEHFIERMQRAGHEEYPGDQMYTCGWMKGFDVYIHARQHGGIHTWEEGDCAHVVSEYGDWEYYAANEGFDQTTGAGVHAAWSNSRHRRREGERGLLQQASNFTVALNDTLASPAVLDGQWAMFDYARGYHPERAACGVSDAFRVPKFAWHFYRSQREAAEQGAGWTGGPELFIASHWTESSSLRVIVYSNCDEVELFHQGVSQGRLRPACTKVTQYLPHPPFVFDLQRFEAGELSATGYVAGAPVARHSVSTPSIPARLLVEFDEQGHAAVAGAVDVLVVRARLVDAHGVTCVKENGLVRFVVSGAARVLGSAEVQAEAGLACVLVRLEPETGRVSVHAESLERGLSGNENLRRHAPLA